MSHDSLEWNDTPAMSANRYIVDLLRSDYIISHVGVWEANWILNAASTIESLSADLDTLRGIK